MRSEHRQWIAYSISVVLLLCLAFYLAVTLDGRANAAGKPEPSRISSPATDDGPLTFTPRALPVKTTAAAVPSVVPNLAVVTPHAALAAAPEKSADPSAIVPIATGETAAPPSPPVQEEVKQLTYETTAYYLNVREEPSAKAKILDVLEQGTILEVLETTDNGWLRLADGGYVHGGYAKQLKDGLVRIASLATVAEQAAKAASDAPAKAEAPASEPSEARNDNADDGEPNKPNSKVASDSGLTIADIDTILSGTALADEGLEQAILEVEEEYGINAYFTIAVMKLESGNGESKIARKKNNLFGLNAIAGDAFNQALSFKTKADCVRKFGQLISDKYVERGYTTIEKVARKYCPANSRWPGHVKDIMNKDYKLL